MGQSLPERSSRGGAVNYVSGKLETWGKNAPHVHMEHHRGWSSQLAFQGHMPQHTVTGHKHTLRSHVGMQCQLGLK